MGREYFLRGKRFSGIRWFRLSVFEKKGVNPETLAQIALKDEKVLQEALDGVLSKKEVVRQNSFQALNFISEKHPEKLYGKWDFFVNLICRGNAFHKYMAIYIIANLTKASAHKLNLKKHLGLH